MILQNTRLVWKTCLHNKQFKRKETVFLLIAQVSVNVHISNKIEFNNQLFTVRNISISLLDYVSLSLIEYVFICE